MDSFFQVFLRFYVRTVHFTSYLLLSKDCPFQDWMLSRTLICLLYAPIPDQVCSWPPSPPLGMLLPLLPHHSLFFSGVLCSHHPLIMQFRIEIATPSDSLFLYLPGIYHVEYHLCPRRHVPFVCLFILVLYCTWPVNLMKAAVSFCFMNHRILGTYVVSAMGH